MATYLVTGAAGFIGSNLVHALIEKGERVRAIDNLATGKRDNLEGVLEKIDFLEGDILDLPALEKQMQGVDFVLHQAAIPSVPRSIDDPLASNRTNVEGTVNVLWAAKQTGVKRVIYAASSSAYGSPPDPVKDEGLPANPLSPYAVSKYAGELYCQVFSQLYGLETVSLRYFNIFGPRQDPASQYAAVIPKLITSMLTGGRPTIFGDGTQSRDFTYIDNVIVANLLACQAKKEAVGEVINIACGETITLNELVETLNDILGTKIKPIHTNPRPGDVKSSLADVSKAKRLLGYTPQVQLREGLEKTVEWFKENK